jgi:hypothetical protein
MEREEGVIECKTIGRDVERIRRNVGGGEWWRQVWLAICSNTQWTS